MKLHPDSERVPPPPGGFAGTPIQQIAPPAKSVQFSAAFPLAAVCCPAPVSKPRLLTPCGEVEGSPLTPVKPNAIEQLLRGFVSALTCWACGEAMGYPFVLGAGVFQPCAPS